jgi:ATP-binding cassette subfamily B protein
MKTHVSDYIQEAFAKQGIPSGQLIYAIHTDMTAGGDFSDVYVAVTEKNLHVLYGEERIIQTSGARRIVADYLVSGFETYALAELGELKTEKLLSTGRMISGEPGKEKLILLYSLGHLGFVERLIKVVKNISGGKDPLTDILVDDELFCPKCGTRYPEPARKLCPKCMDRVSLTLRLLGFFKKYATQAVLVILMMIASTALMIASPYLGTKMLIDEVLTEGGRYFGLVGLMVGLLVFVRAVNVGFNILFSYVLARVMPWIIYDLRLRIFEAMQKLSVGFYTSKRTGALMNRVNKDTNNIFWFFVDGVPFLIVNILLFIGVVTLMFVLNWQLALICVTVIPICILLFKVLFRIFQRFHHKNWIYNSKMNSMVSDAVNGQRVIKAFARESQEVERFAETGGRQAGIETRMVNLGFTAFPLIYMLMFIGQVIVTAVGGIMVLKGNLTIGMLMTFIAYLTMLYQPLEFLSWVSNWWARCMDASQRVFEIIDSKPDVQEPENPIVLDELKGDICVKDVWFQYDPATPVLKGLSIEVQAGKTLGIVGKTGAGKSTLANLIARLYDCNEGSVFVDGINVKELSLEQLRRSIGIVSQDIYLFIGSIMDNIRYAKPDATLEEVIWAAKMASAHDFIMTLPDGYETRVGAGGQDLSGGERQRLSIARTIVQNPKILILDEATAAMDTETEGKIQAALNKLQTNRTTIAIAHRLSTLKDADSLAVIHEGKVVESGTHEELMKLKKEYHKLFMIQMEGLKVISMD